MANHGHDTPRMLLAAVVIGGALVVNSPPAEASSSCALSRAETSEPRRVGHRDALAGLSELAAAVHESNQSKARSLVLKVSTDIAAIHSARDIRAMLKTTRALFDDEMGYPMVLEVARGVLSSLDPISRQKTIVDTAFLRAYFKAVELAHERSPNALEASRDRIRQRIRNARICEARKFFLLLGHANFTEKWRGYPDVTAEISDLENRVETLTGISAQHLPIRWFARREMTLSAVDANRFDLAARYLQQTEREAADLLADANLDPRARKEVALLMETLAPYFRQERVKYFCPTLNTAKPEPCRFQR